LIPSVNWAINNEERILISTNTINLQEQLINKDIPLLKDALGLDFKYSLIKGMRNYLCVLRTETLNEGLFDFIEDSEHESIKSIIEWSKITTDGSLSDLSFTPSDDVWEKVSAESESCLRARCPHYSDCFFYNSRREISDSQILVTNHHLLFSDLAIKEVGSETEIGIIPPYKRVVFDEAHNIVDSATSHFSMRLTKFGLVRVLRRLRSKSKNKKLKGLIFYSSSLAEKAKDNLIKEILERSEKVFLPILEQIEIENEDAFDSLYNFGLFIFNEPLHNKNEINIRVTHRVFEDEGWEDIYEKFIKLRNSLIRLYEEIRYFIELIEMNENGNSFLKLVAEFNGVNNKIYYFSNVIDTFLDKTDDSYVRWFEGRVGRSGILCGIGLSPLDVSAELKEKLYSKAKTIVMTSATLSVNKNFDFQKYHLGLMDNERINELIVKSPFNFREQALLLIPNDIPEPNHPAYEDYIEDLIVDSIKISKGNALVLFTSYASLNRVFENVEKRIKEDLSNKLELLKQGDLPRAKLLEKFKLI
ncbi:MAG: hypothetical protein GTN59_03365, partial [Candidatus Dadabacteria bacterium]|nr:hypothetical protein [Candidatus Dadabacteria bacterium]